MAHNDIEDDILLKRIQDDDEKAFDQLFTKYYPGLIRYCKSHLPYPSDEAEDVLLEVFFKIWQNRKRLLIHTSLVSFLYMSVKNRIHDHYRKKSREIYRSAIDIADEAVPDYLIPDQLLAFKELSAEIDKMINMLPARTQLVFCMSRYDNLTYENIALLLDISINSVKTHMYRAIKFLKEVYRSSNTSREG